MMKEPLKVLIAAFGLSWPLAGAQAQSQPAAPVRHELSVKQALEYAARNNVQVKNALIDVQIQQQVNREVTSAAYPQVSATGNFTDNLKLQTQLLPGEFFGQPAGTFVPITFGTKYVTTGAVDVSQILFDGQVFVGLQARKTSIQWKQKNAEITDETIRANVYKVYYQLVLSKTQVALLDANIALIEKLKHDAQIMYENGFAEKLDVDKNDVQLTNLHTEKEKVLVSVANGYNGLKILLGIPVKDQLVLTDSMNDEQIRSEVLENAGYSYEDRRDYQYLKLSQKLNEFNVKRYQYSKIPTLSAFFNYNRMNMENDFRFNGQWFEASYVGLRLSIPIFKGFGTNAKIRQAQLAVKQTDNQLENLRNTIDNEVETAKNTFRSSISIMDYQKKNMALAETVYNQTKKKYEVGTGSQTEINTAQTDLKTAQSNYISALYDAVVAKVDYLKAVGKL
ncbi:TolC family protein [Taibaiella helva]|uniref:TolC family protein n=1 Tax=Taibaiella helva TaxID=2301235 RepID=UPI001E43DB57|nr:TolC family protein [Taibaiella helva]